jgi:hypothetical protein
MTHQEMQDQYNQDIIEFHRKKGWSEERLKALPQLPLPHLIVDEKREILCHDDEKEFPEEIAKETEQFINRLKERMP